MPWTAGLLLVLTAVPSIVLALIQHTEKLGFFDVALIPDRIVHGQVWRLATWTFCEPSPLSLLFTCFFLYWLGRDLGDSIGPKRFLQAYFGIGISTALLVIAVGLTDPSVNAMPVLGAWPICAGLSIVWGWRFPDRVIRIYFVLPVRGAWIAALTVGITVLYGIYADWRAVLPEIAAELVTLGFLRALALRGAARKRQVVVKHQKKRAAVAYLKVVESHDDEPPPLPKDIEAQLGDLFDPKRKR